LIAALSPYLSVLEVLNKMAEESKVPNVKDGLASGVQTVGGVPSLVKEVVPVDDTGAGQDIDAGKEKERVMAAFRSGKPEETGPEERSESETRGLATGVQTVGGTPVLQKEVASMEKPDDSAVGAKEKERVLTAFYSGTPEHTGLEKGSETAESTGALATGLQTVGGVPVLKKEVASIEKPEDSDVGAKEKERVLAAFHSKEPSETTPAAESAPATIGEQGAEPSPKASKKGTIAALKDKVAHAFKSEAKPAEEEKVTVEIDGEKPGAPSLKDRVYQSVGSLGDRVKSQATSLRTSWKSENKVGTEAKEVDAEAVKPASEPTPGDAEKVEVETPAVSLESPGKEKTTVKERVIQRVGSLSEKVKLQASAMKSAWKPEDKKGADADSPKPAVSETSPKPSAEESVATYEHGEGRITVFSISGCPHCKAAKELLKKKKVKFAEINLDVFPERREEMQERTGKSSCPQIFFNDKLIGGNDSLQVCRSQGP
jgi:glutaredoxin